MDLSLKSLKSQDKLFYGWIIVMALFAMATMMQGVRFSFGVFFKSIEADFTLTRTTTSAIYSMYLGLGSIFPIMAGLALDRYGPRMVMLIMSVFTGLSLVLTGQATSTWQLFMTYSMLLAMGTSAAYIITTSTVTKWFDRKRGLAMGIASSGTGLGPVIIAPLATYLISSSDWRTANIVIGLIAWVVLIPSAFLLRRDPAVIPVLPDSTNPGLATVNRPGADSKSTTGHFRSVLSMFRQRNFQLVLLIWAFNGSATFFIFAHLVPHITDLELSPEIGALTLSFIGIANIIGRLVMGTLSDNLGRRGTAIFCALVQFASILSLIWIQSPLGFYAFAIVYGFTNGGLSTTLAAYVGTIFGLFNLGLILGFLEIGWGLGSAIGPTLGGFIFDTTGGYSIAFIIESLVTLFAGVLVYLIRTGKKTVVS